MKLEKEVKALAKVGQMGPAARTRQDEADRLKTEAQALKDKARLEDLHIWQMKVVKGKKATRTYTYWMASWREGNRVRNVYLGSVKNIDAETARQKARKIKAEALGLQPVHSAAEGICAFKKNSFSGVGPVLQLDFNPSAKNYIHY